MSSLAFVLAPLIIAAAVALQASARRPEDRGAEGIRMRQVAWVVALVQLASAVVSLESGGLDPFFASWMPAAGFDPVWRLDSLGAWGVAIMATRLPELLESRGASARMAIAILHLGVSALVAADDLGSMVIAVVLISAGRSAWLASDREGWGGRARRVARRAQLEAVLAAAAAVTLALSASTAHQIATQGRWSVRLDDLGELIFTAGLEGQNLVLMGLALAPALAAWPFGAEARALGARSAPGYLRLAPVAVAALFAARAVPLLAPRLGPEWAGPIAGMLLAGAGVAFLAARSRGDERARGRWSVHLEAPVVMVAALTPGVWGTRALALGVLALALRVAQGEGGARGWVARASAAAVPGTLGFASLAATWAALVESHQVYEAGTAAGIALGLGLLMWGRPGAPSRAPRALESRVSTLRDWLAVLACFVGGTLPALVMDPLVPHAESRATEVQWRRCVAIELEDLLRPRLRREMSLGCSRPREEIERYYEPPPVSPEAADPTDRFVSSLDDPANEAPRPAFELPSRREGGVSQAPSGASSQAPSGTGSATGEASEEEADRP